ncbi:hypothetical protein ACLGL1_07990 [Peptococcus simiae]
MTWMMVLRGLRRTYRILMRIWGKTAFDELRICSKMTINELRIW